MRHRLLVANRAEIACRIFQACHEMGIEAVALNAQGDEARHLVYADRVLDVPSYLDAKAIVEVAQKANVDLIHPGYGFLSERPFFADLVEKAGIRFIGPRPETMELLGGKIQAKELADSLGIPVLKWDRISENEDLRVKAKSIGFPLLLKASAGGGGKGMRVVREEKDLESFAESASAEARAAFGDGTLFMERYVDRPRHIEVQVFGDGRGHAVHLYERECSLQRRHQKVWEEACAPHLSQEAKERLYDAALKLARHTKYRSAGTVEFLVDDQENFFFLEMNTRLQVEHPVSEQVTGVDLVCTQITQALAENEEILNGTPSKRGHSIEVRIYAEDPSQGFMPTPGRVEKLCWPTGTGIRVESGIAEGQNLDTQFDPMLGKLIVHAENRSHAIRRMDYALKNTVILGLGTNQGYLLDILNHPAVQEGRVYTKFLEQELELTKGPSEEDVLLWQKARESGFGKGDRDFISSGGLSVRSPWEDVARRGVQL